MLQWELFTKKTKNDFLTQRRLFQKDLERIQAEIHAATENGQGASESVKHLIYHGVPAPTPVEERDGDAWDELMAEAEEPPPTGFLREALQAAQQMTAARPPGLAPPMSGGMMTQEAALRLLAATMQHMPPQQAHVGPEQVEVPHPAVPVQTEAGARPTTQPSMAPQQAPTSVYVPSPSHPGTTTHVAGNSPQGHGPSPRPRKPRVPVKGAPLQTVQTVAPGSLSDKLDAKRRAMQPFGVGPHQAPTDATTQPPQLPPQEAQVRQNLGHPGPDANATAARITTTTIPTQT